MLHQMGTRPEADLRIDRSRRIDLASVNLDRRSIVGLGYSSSSEPVSVGPSPQIGDSGQMRPLSSNTTPSEFVMQPPLEGLVMVRNPVSV